MADIDFKLLFESTPGIYLVLSPEFDIVAATEERLTATMTKREDIIGRNLFDVFPDNPDDPGATGVRNLTESLRRVAATKTADVMAVQQYDIPRPESEGGGFEERFWSPLNSPVLDPLTGELRYIIHRVVDVTEFVQLKQQRAEQDKQAAELKSHTGAMEMEIFRRAQQLQDANKKLREAEQVKSDFFANISHELRTPLSLILAPLESLLSGRYDKDDGVTSKYLQTMHNNAVRLLRMVSGLLDFAKFDAGKMRVESEPTDLAALTRSILTDFTSMANGKQLHLSEHISADRFVLIDRYLFERILFNLVANAIKFTPEGGSITVEAVTDADMVRLSVTDTGIGIAEADIKNLFQKFRQAQGSSTRRFEGTGLGLAMVKEFAELMGGQVSVVSSPGHGSAFTVMLSAPVTTDKPMLINVKPKRQQYEYGDTTMPEAQDAPAQGRTNMLKLLICEDNDDLAAYIISLLHSYCQLKRVKNGREGLDAVYTWRPDLVLTDVMMPETDGITLCETVKSDPETAGITVVLLTALTHREALIRGWNARADEYLFKPFHPDELVTRVRSLLTSIGDKKEAMQIIEQKNAALQVLNRDLEAFTYSVSHDLRTPLRAISGYSQILAHDYKSILNDDGRQMLARVIHSVKKMNTLIDDLLAFSKLGRKELNRTTVQMKELTEGICQELKSSMHSKAEIEIGDLLPVQADQPLMYQVMQNLVSNALKYSSKVENPVVSITSSEEDGFINYTVTDNGAGFDMAFADKLFGVFERLHPDSQFEGTGVGLAIVERIIHKHGGRIRAEGEEGKGASFYISLPAGA